MNLSSKPNTDYREYYDGDQVEYYVKLTDNPISNSFLDIKKKILKSVIKSRLKNKEIVSLDVACGYGRLTCFLEEMVHESYGIDVSRDMLEVAKKRCMKTRFLIHDLSKKPLNKKFDLITSFRFFVNAQENLKRDMVSGIHSHLRKDGLFICNIHKNLSLPLLLFYLFQRFFYGRKTNIVSYRDIKRLLEPRFDIIEVHGFDYCGFSRLTFIRNKSVIKYIISFELILEKILPPTLATNVLYVCRPR